MASYSELLREHTITVEHPAKALLALIDAGNDGGQGEYEPFLPRAARIAGSAGGSGEWDCARARTTRSGKRVVFWTPLAMSPAQNALADAHCDALAMALDPSPRDVANAQRLRARRLYRSGAR